VDMAQGRIGFEHQPVGHDVLCSEVTIDQPLQNAALQWQAGDLSLMEKARPLLN
jgi:hypothetical protein